MVSRFLRRSGVSAALEVARLGWQPTCVIQVGIGFYHQEVDVMKEEWPDCEFIGFEACTTSYNKISNYPGTLINKAIADKHGVIDLYVKPNHKDGSSVLEFPEEVRHNIQKVEASTLDNEIGDLTGKEVMLWLDCEGSELAVLHGATRILEYTTAVNVEMTPKPPSPTWPSPGEVHDKLRQAGFYRSWVHTMKGGQYDALYTKPSIFQSQYCICPYTVKEFEEEQNVK